MRPPRRPLTAPYSPPRLVLDVEPIRRRRRGWFRLPFDPGVAALWLGIGALCVAELWWVVRLAVRALVLADARGAPFLP